MDIPFTHHTLDNGLDEAIHRLAGALQEFTVVGVKTAAQLCAKILLSDRFRRGDLSPDLIDQFVPKPK